MYAVWISLICVTFTYGEVSQSEIDWFGDQRGGKPQDNFYDLVYDENACPTSIKGNAVSNYVFVGSIIKMVFVAGSSECLIECYKETRCKSVNFYPSRRTGIVKNVCELNEASQIFNPNSMQQYTGATYYENIECAGGKENLQQKSQGLIKNSPQDEHGANGLEEQNLLRQPNSLRLFKEPEQKFSGLIPSSDS